MQVSKGSTKVQNLSRSIDNFKRNLEGFKVNNINNTKGGHFWDVSYEVLSRIEEKGYLKSKDKHKTAKTSVKFYA